MKRMGAMNIFKYGCRLSGLALILLIQTMPCAFAQASDKIKLDAALVCGPFSEKPPRTPAFADKFAFEFSNNALTGLRQTRAQKGAESYKGSIDAAGKITISGTGRFDDRSSEWSSAYTGQLREKGPTILHGTLRIKGAAPRTHKCTIAFQAPAELVKAAAADEAKPRAQ
jgi:hypothetical protein